MRIYIAGPMTGLPNDNREAFNTEAVRIRISGHDAINPVRVSHDLETDLYPAKPTWHQYLAMAITALSSADAIHFLDDWEYSHGARIESLVAIRMKLPIWLSDGVILPCGTFAWMDEMFSGVNAVTEHMQAMDPVSEELTPGLSTECTNKESRQ